MFIGSRLRDLRKEKKMTQSELGNLLNVTKVSICCYEKNVRIPSVETLEDLSNIFNVSTDYFLGRDVSLVGEEDNNYSVYVSKEEIDFFRQLRLNKDLFEKIIKDPKRMIELIDKKLK